ncbi:MAG: acyltransferase [Pseudomonadota bacterium]|nr:acyltransferase [Pseudomonadota bacterium]|tara:strand:+ start:718 stop:1296 length:579 start_codon:yes stop_codon:yes gene_type:complete
MKSVLKKCIHLIAIIAVSPLIVLYFVLNIVSSDNCFAAFSQFLSLFPGKSGNFLRGAFYRITLMGFSQDSFIGFATLLSQKNTVIKQGVYIGPQCNIGACVIEKDCLLGSGVHILSGKQQHNFDDLDKPIREQGGHFQPITLGEDTWAGNGAIIMANVGKKCVVAAGAVVTKDIPDFAIVAGNPATIIKMRK